MYQLGFVQRKHSFKRIKWVSCARVQRPALQCCWSPPPHTHLSNPLWNPAKQWISSHYVPNTQPLAGPFPRRFTNLTAYHSTSLTMETFLEILNPWHKWPSIYKNKQQTNSPNFAGQKVITLLCSKENEHIKNKTKYIVVILSNAMSLCTKQIRFPLTEQIGSFWTAEPYDMWLLDSSVWGFLSI